MNTQNKPSLVVLAAGMGSRYGGLKQIESVGPAGQVILDYSLYDARHAGFQHVVFIIRKDIEQPFKEKIGNVSEKHFQVSYVYQQLNKLPSGFVVPPQRTKPWGTAHAILCAKEAVNGPFAVINADDFYGRSALSDIFKQLVSPQDHSNRPIFCMAGYILENTLSDHGCVSRGLCTVDDSGLLNTITECEKIEKYQDIIRYQSSPGQYTELDPKLIVSMNLFGFTPYFFDEIESRFPLFLKSNIDDINAEFYMPSVLSQLLRENKVCVKVMTTDEKWLGVTYREDVLTVRNQFAQLTEMGVYPTDFWR